MMTRGILASLVVSGILVGAWAACLPSEPAFDASLDPSLDASSDSPIEPAVRCEIGADFELKTPAPLFEKLNGINADRQGAFLSDDEKRIYFGLDNDPRSKDAGGDGYTWSLVVATRGDRTAKFGAPERLKYPINGFSQQRRATLDREETTLFFAAADIGFEQLYYATRPNAFAEFGPPQRLAAVVNEDPTTNIDPFLHTWADGGRDLWYVHIDPFLGTRIRRFRITGVDLTADASFEGPENLDFTPDEEVTPVVSADGLELFFAREVPDKTDSGHPDPNIWHAKRASPSSPFELATALANVNTKVYDRPGWLSRDGCRLYFLSARDNGNTDTYLNIYMAERPRKP